MSGQAVGKTGPPGVLLIEDEALVRRSLTRLLERAGYRVRCAASGEDTVALLRREHADAVLCDCHLPGLSGVAFLEQLRPPSAPAEHLATG